MMNKSYRKYFVIILTGAFGILCGYNLKELIISNEEMSFWSYIKPISYFLLMLVMLYEWVKILRNEKVNNAQ